MCSTRITKRRCGRGRDERDVLEVQLLHYFATDWCKLSPSRHRASARGLGHVVLMDVEVLWMSEKNSSWVSEGLALLRAHPDLLLVMPAFPGLEQRRIRRRPWTRELQKVHKRLAEEALDTTCDHPYSLPGWVSLLDLQRYRQLGGWQSVREHRCGGQLVKGKPCKTLTDIRGLLSSSFLLISRLWWHETLGVRPGVRDLQPSRPACDAQETFFGPLRPFKSFRASEMVGCARGQARLRDWRSSWVQKAIRDMSITFSKSRRWKSIEIQLSKLPGAPDEVPLRGLRDAASHQGH